MGISTYNATVSRVQDLTYDVRQLDVTLVEPPAISFKPGQFISFEVPKKGFPAPVVRPYSIASPPSQDHRLTLLFNLVADGPGSTYLYSLRIGDHTTFKGPAGSFWLKDDAGRDLLFVATGTGIAPIRSMIAAQLERGTAQTVTLFWGLRSQRDLYYQEEFLALTQQFPKFSFVTTLSRSESGWTGVTGRVTSLVRDRVTSVRNLAVYLCGNSGMIQEVTALVQTRGLCPIHKEKYYDDRGEPTD
jgi:CDP-4-dehydro-6-deoxyglucose reductase, E3